MIDAERRRQRRTVVWTFVLSAVTAAASWWVGVGWPQVLLLVSAITTAGAVALALGHVDEDPMLPPLEATGRSEGTRREVSRLSWSLAGADNRVGDRPYRRLRAIAAHRLALRGIDLTDPAGDDAARALLGPVGYQQLVGESWSPPTQRVFADCISLLERLDSSPSSPPTMIGKKPMPVEPPSAVPSHAESVWGPV